MPRFEQAAGSDRPSIGRVWWLNGGERALSASPRHRTGLVSVPVERVDDPGHHPVVDLADAPVDPVALEGLLVRAGREVDEGLLPACQIAVGYRGRLLASRTYGAAPASRFVIYSCTKAITAGAVWRLMGDGLLAPGTRVAELVPRFAEHGKGAVTVEHLLTHTAGVPERPHARRGLGRPASPGGPAGRLDPRVGAREPLRLPRHLRALGVGRADRVGDRQRLPDLRVRGRARSAGTRHAPPGAGSRRPAGRARGGRRGR